jgi:hypothetical protein
MVAQKPGHVKQVLEVTVASVGTFFILINRETEVSLFSGN